MRTKREWGVHIRKVAKDVLKLRGDNPDVATQVGALLNSRNDTLSDEVILKELRGLSRDGYPWVEVFESNDKQVRMVEGMD